MDEWQRTSGRIGYGPGDNPRLTDELRQWFAESTRLSQESKGGLLGVVEVRVHEKACEPQVTFPQGALLGIDPDALAISEMVARARGELADWR